MVIILRENQKRPLGGRTFFCVGDQRFGISRVVLRMSQSLAALPVYICFFSYSSNAFGLKMSMPAYRTSESKSLSPVMMHCASPAIAVPSTVSSSGSRQTGVSNVAGSIMTNLPRSSAIASSMSAGFFLNFSASFSRNSLRMNSEVIGVNLRATF